eukprot:2235784-Pyramimonas_sp.AAC.1
MAERGTKFGAWIEEQSLGGGGGPRAITKVPSGFDPGPASQQELYAPTDLAGEVSGLEEEWRRWWRCNLHQAPVRWPQDLGGRPPKPSVEELQATLRTFPVLTGTSFDAISPR